MNEAKKLKFSKKGLIIDRKKYGNGITKVEIVPKKIIIHCSELCKNFEKIKTKGMNNPLELIKYDNIKIILDEDNQYEK